jgi:hypothetical protein
MDGMVYTFDTSTLFFRNPVGDAPPGSLFAVELSKEKVAFLESFLLPDTFDLMERLKPSIKEAQ